jgi:glycosyltransferase involved in cell wall biosynthesis
MHSGNHSIAHSLETLFEAAKQTHESSQLRFLFVGGGVAKKPIETWVKEHQPKHIQCLPYQPISHLGDVLGASTVQVVVVGEQTVGIVHPSKIYGAIAAAKPILVIGPAHSPAAQLVLKEGIGWQVEHGDVTGLVNILRKIEKTPEEELATLGERAQVLANGSYARTTLLERITETVTQSF